MENMHRKYLKTQPKIVNGSLNTRTFSYNYVHINSIPVSDHMCEGSGGSCTGMRSVDGAWEVRGGTASFVGVVSVNQ